VVVSLKAVGVNPVDSYIRTGGYALKPSLPYTPGMDAAGTVLSVGDGVDNVQLGERVYVGGTLRGAYAEQTLCEAAQVHPLPARVSFAQGAGVNVPYATAYRALYQRAQGRPGETVLVHGASGGARGRAQRDRDGRHGERTKARARAGRAPRTRSSPVGLRGPDHDVDEGPRRRCHPRNAR